MEEVVHLHNELSKISKLNERLRYGLRMLNKAHTRTKRFLAAKSEEHKAMHKAARALVTAATQVSLKISPDGQGTVTEYLVDGALVAALRSSLPIIKPRPPRLARVTVQEAQKLLNQEPSQVLDCDCVSVQKHVDALATALRLAHDGEDA